METTSLLRELAEARGPSGYEAEIRDRVRRSFGERADEVRVDAVGNLIALRRGEGPEPRPSIMLAGHMDEIALMVSQIEKGFLRVAQIGGFDPRVLLGQEVVVHGTRELDGLVVSVPPHFTDAAEREKPVPLEKLFVDVGLPPSEVETLVRVGDLVTLRGRFLTLAGGYAACKSLDDRVAVAAVTLCLEELSRRRRTWDVYAVATTQEEVGLKGAVTSGYGIRPTVAIAIDATFGIQPGLSPAETQKMDAGPSIALGPNIHPAVYDRLVAAAKAIELPYQVEALPGSTGTDAWALQVSRSGLPCGLVSIPVRSMHTPVETVCLRDIERTARLLAELISRLDDAFAGQLETRDALSAPPAASAPPDPKGKV
ncbi:MAG TPA: M20/M25/M40 family metallo-hydrolase [Spirochaetia bacterium]|nr:M20/M25/M40 family metallo-hydrolase [Spirochaetia bacterium]